MGIPESVRVPKFVGKGKIETHERVVAAPGEGQLLVEVKANALCGSERGQFYDGTATTPGHEAAGIVVGAGAGTRTKVGTPGVIFLMDFCGECRSCRLGFTNQCLAKRCDMGFNRDGGYGRYELVHENIFFPVDARMPLTEATMLLDIMGTGAHAIGRGKGVRQDVESLLIAGAGPIGLGVLAMAKILLGRDVPVLIFDMVGYRLKLAGQLGGLPIDLGTTTVADGIKRHGLGAPDMAVDTSGKEAARRQCVSALGQRGALVCVGHGEGIQLDVSRDLIGPQRAVVGSEYFEFRQLPGNLALLKQHLPYLKQIITHRFPVERIQHAFELFFGGDTGKVVIEQ